MIEIYSNADYQKVQCLYALEQKKFPFIYSVLSGMQRGRVWVDEKTSPKAAFICHDFGWAQLIGDNNSVFEKQLSQFLFQKELFSSLKLRIFSPRHDALFSDFCVASERQQFFLGTNEKTFEFSIPYGYKIHPLNSSHTRIVSEALGLDLFRRNWSSQDTFDTNSFGYFASSRGVPVAACYSCARMNKIQEIDVFTIPAHQGKGLARALSTKFILACRKKKFFPSWDCFTNNTASMKLNKTLGFLPVDDPYRFFTYSRSPRGN